jgi:hypothetical protein
MKKSLRIERVGSVTDDKTGAVAHDHHVFEGDDHIGSFRVAKTPGVKMPQFKLGGGLKTRHAGPILKFIQSNYEKSLLFKAKNFPTPEDRKRRKEAQATRSMPGYDGTASSDRAISSAADPSDPPAKSRQRAMCSTEGCDQPVSFVQVRNKHGFHATHESCPNCGVAENPVPRRVASSTDSAAVDQDNRREKAWRLEQAQSLNAVTKSQAGNELATPKPAQDTTKIEPHTMDHDRRRIRTAIQNLLAKKETKHSPDGKVNLAKAIAAHDKYRQVEGMLHHLSAEITERVGRKTLHPHHEHAAMLLRVAGNHLHHARRGLLQDAPSRVDHIRGVLGLEPSSMKNLQAAEAHVLAATRLTISGDKGMQAHKHWEGETELSKQPMPKLTLGQKIPVVASMLRYNRGNESRGSAGLIAADVAQRQGAAPKPSKVRGELPTDA